jgi:hypothetical protein
MEDRMTRIWAGLIGSAALVLASPLAAAPPDKAAKGGQAEQKEHGQAKADSAKKAKHNHKNNSGHAMLGAKLKQDGKHSVGKFKDRDVVAEVKGGKVHNMTAGDMQAKRVRTKTKMAASDGAFILASWNGQLQLAQDDVYYYGYCFDDGVDFDCYWYPAEDVDYQDYAWEDYDPYY